jgi:FMN-dependent NADH-azoreductase
MAEKYVKFHAVKFGLAGGIVAALCVALTTIAGIFGWCPEYTTLAFEWLASIYGFLGFTGANWLSALLGAIYSFIDGFIFTWVFALIYNKLVK